MCQRGNWLCGEGPYCLGLDCICSVFYLRFFWKKSLPEQHCCLLRDFFKVGSWVSFFFFFPVLGFFFKYQKALKDSIILENINWNSTVYLDRRKWKWKFSRHFGLPSFLTPLTSPNDHIEQADSRGRRLKALMWKAAELIPTAARQGGGNCWREVWENCLYCPHCQEARKSIPH